MSPINIDEDQRFSVTVMWKLQQAFYAKNNIRCWQECVVPNFVSSNCFIAQVYCRTIFGFLRDYFGRRSADDAEDAKQPVYIIETGAGSAKLSYVLLTKLLDMSHLLPKRRSGDGGDGSASLKDVPRFKYVITDFCSENFDFWMNHPRFSEYIESGVLDFATLDCESDSLESIRLEMSGVTLSKDIIRHPVIAIANYVFDTLKQDAFRVVDGQLEEVLCTTTSSADIDVRNPELLRYIKCSWKPRRCNASGYYVDPSWNGLLEALRASYTSASFLLPVGALTAIASLKRLSGGRLILLAGDKGYVSANELEGIKEPHVAIHGSFSCMVNFRALHAHCEHSGGFVMHSSYQEGFKVSAMAWGVQEEECPQFRMSCRMCFEGFGPDGFSTLQRCLKEENRGLSLRSALALVRLSSWDPDVFYKLKHIFIEKGPYASTKHQEDIKQDVLKVYALYYPLLPSKDIAFEVGRIFMGLKDFARAADFFKDSQRYCGVHHVSWYNMGVCHYYLKQWDACSDCFNSSLKLCPDYPDALKWLEKLMLQITDNAKEEG